MGARPVPEVCFSSSFHRILIEVYTDIHYILPCFIHPVFSLLLFFTRVGSAVTVKDFKSSWRSGVAFHAILCSLRPDLVDMSLTETRSNLENLEEAFRIAQQELGIPRLLEPVGGCNFLKIFQLVEFLSSFIQLIKTFFDKLAVKKCVLTHYLAEWCN